MPKAINKDTENKIIEAATDLFGKKGFEGVSTREICKLANVNLSLISCYFGGKKELYEKVVNNITDKIISNMKEKMGFQEVPKDFDSIPKSVKVEKLFTAIGFMVDYFYSDSLSDSEIMIIYKEQIVSGVPLNAIGYNIFRKLVASILEKDEQDKEVILRCITIVASVHSARVFKQFSLNMMGQSGYSKEDIQMLKHIIIGQVEVIFKSLGALDDA